MKSGDVLDGRFRIDDRVGAGGMGVVYRAFDLQTNRRVAVKVLDPSTPVEVERAFREAEVLLRLEHPAIVAHVAHGVVDGKQFFLAMDWVDGCTAADRLAGQGFTLRETIAMIRQIADALALAHGEGIVHRDIKPTNVLLHGGDPAAATLIDFGIARVTDTLKALTRTGVAVGTPAYMAPEQGRGERVLSPAVDVFGLASLLYECAAGQPAFSGSLPVAVIAKILLAEPVPLVQLCPECPPALSALVARMHAKDPKDRPADGASVVRELEKLGLVPDGPRRSSQRLTNQETVRPAEAEAHCVVIAARGQLDDVLEPPSPEVCAALVRAGEPYYAQIEILATGAVAAHLTGAARDVTTRAASCALDMKKLLPGHSIAVSTAAVDVGAASDTATSLLSNAVLGDIFRGAGGSITVETGVRSVLEETFELETGPRGDVKLTGRKRT